MNELKVSASAFLAIIAGAAIATISSVWIFPLWYELGIRRPVGEYLISAGLEELVGAWGVAWGEIPDWAIAFISGFVIGRSFAGKRLALYACLFATGMFLLPNLVGYFFMAPHPWAEFSSRMIALALLWKLIALPVFANGIAIGSARRERTRVVLSIGGISLATVLIAGLLAVLGVSTTLGVPIFLFVALTGTAVWSSRWRANTLGTVVSPGAGPRIQH